MPTYMYKAVTSTGLVVRNRVEAGSKQNLLRTLKENDLMPITIEQVAYSAKKKKTKKIVYKSEMAKTNDELRKISKRLNQDSINKFIKERNGIKA